MSQLLSTAAAMLLFLGVAAPATAKIPALNHTCPIGAGMYSDAEGRVYVNGQEAELKAAGKDRYTATVPGLVITIAVNADGSPRVSYTENGVSGSCREIPPPSEDNG